VLLKITRMRLPALPEIGRGTAIVNAASTLSRLLFALAGRALLARQYYGHQAVAVAIAKATWAWVRGKCEEAMREVLGRGEAYSVQAEKVETAMRR
jgi:hypothetical protein